ncbi:Protein kinase domain-containing protein [Psidium guajava]|nr:Protein kinase domain-containing protein [Psidium guajava]
MPSCFAQAISFHLFILLLLFAPLPSVSNISLSVRNVTLFGEASFGDHSIILTQNLSHCTPFSSRSRSSASSGIGRGFYAYPVRFLDPSSNSSASFFCRFSFAILRNPSCPFGDGLAFLITSDTDSFSPVDGYLGLPAPAFGSRESSFIAVEMDTSFDPSFEDINGNHVGIDVNSVYSLASVDAVSRGVDLRSGKQITTWIEYRNAVKLVRVWISYSHIRPTSPALVAQIDLSKHFKEYMHVGFSASNSKGSAVHIVSHWRFRTFGLLPTSTSDDVNVRKGECSMCSTEDLIIDMDGSESDLRDAGINTRDMALGLGGLAAFLISLILILSVASFYLIKNSGQIKMRTQAVQRFQSNKVPTRLSLAEIRAATMGFSKSKIIGEGASATVYQGCLPSGGAVAIKRFDRENRVMNCRCPFTTEFATMVSCLRHKNLVQLQGWCCEGNELLLIYEYMPNGSLDTFLHKSSNSAKFLSWEQRKKVVLGVASALAYLHEECERQIIHRDVKSCNIMLDSEFNAKLGDFGLAEVYEHSCRTRAVTIPAGTMGYLAPEYVYYGVPTTKSDVYSFGVLVLEVATGRLPVDRGGVILVDWVWGLWEKGKLISAVDRRLRGQFNEAEMARMLRVGLCCVQADPEKRPPMKEVARILKGEDPMPRLPPRKPTVRIQSVLPEQSKEILTNRGDQSPGCDDMPYMTPKSHFG